MLVACTDRITKKQQTAGKDVEGRMQLMSRSTHQQIGSLNCGLAKTWFKNIYVLGF